MNRFPWLGYLPFLDGDDGAGAGGSQGEESKAAEGEAKPEKLFTQEDVEKAIHRRLMNDRKKWEADRQAELDKAKMSEAERLKAEKAEAEKAAEARVSAANQRLIRAEATVQAAALDIKPDRIKYALKLADLAGVEIGDDGEPDGKAIQKALEAVLKELPELKADAGASRSGGQFNGQNGYQGKNPWAKTTFNLTEQARILRENPGLATQLQQAAKG